VIDSGLYQGHWISLIKTAIRALSLIRISHGENRTDDPYGHGTHVAGIAAANGRIANAAYLGIAPNAKLINLRVLNSQGTGTVSGTLAALDWLMANKAIYNIRVVNMSIGHSRG
jgi:serine protease AprX